MIVRYLALLGFLTCLMWDISSAGAAADLELYGTFHAMGVIVTMDAGDDSDADAEASVTYRTGSEAFQSGFPLSRITADRFVGSLFRLEPGTAYEVHVTISDPDGGALDGTVLQGSMSTRSEIEIPTPQGTFYVHPAGSGTECSLAAPCALTQGISLAGPGDEVVLRGGTYAVGNITMPRNGSYGAPIVVRGYAGETAVLDGADQQTYTWTADSGGVYTTTAQATDVHLVMADGKRIFPYESLDNLIDLYWDDTPGFFQDGTTLYVHLENDINPNSASMIVSRYGTAFTVEQDNIYFLDLTFKHYGQGSYPKVFYLNNASDILIQNCNFIDNDMGIGIKRESHRNVIQDNTFSETIFDWPWGAIKTLGGLEDGGVRFYDPVTGRGNIIRRNTFHDDFDGFGICPATTAALTNETDVYDNVVYNMGDDGIETDGRCSNVRIWGNTFHDVLIGISLAPVYDGPVYALRNLVYRTGVGNNDYPGSPFKFNSGYDPSGPMYLFHNTSDAVLPDNNGIHIKAPGNWSMIYARNNIWAGTDYAINNYNTANPVDMDYDNLYNAGLNDLARWDNIRYTTLSEFSVATGQETNGLNVKPGFLDAGQQIYTLDPLSDLVDAGVYIPGINQGYSGSAPDMGAFELDTGPGDDDSDDSGSGDDNDGGGGGGGCFIHLMQM
jgi:parallel beta-helix repeat protein